jgi:hypothetical protein
LPAISVDSAIGGFVDVLLWGTAYLNFLLAGCIVCRLLARFTPGREPPAFAWKWFDFFRRPADREPGVEV